MKFVIILNINPHTQSIGKIIDNAEYTKPELKKILEDELNILHKDIIFYDSFEEFKKNYLTHLNDFIVNFDYGKHSRFRNMTVPGFCDCFEIKYSNPDPYAQIICQDKFTTTNFAKNFGIMTPKSILLFKHMLQSFSFNHLSYPIIIKPNYESESIGITQKSIADTPIEARTISRELLENFDGILLEEYIEGNEIAITLFKTKEISIFYEVELLIPSNLDIKYNIFTSEIKNKKYIELKKSEYLDVETSCKLKELYEALSPGKLIRIDGRFKDDCFYLIEINANPGLYPGSIVPRTFKINNIAYDEMLSVIFKM